MDADFPFAHPFPPGPTPDLPAAPPPREPAWSGIELAAIVLFTVAAIVALSLIAVLGWAILAHASGLGESATARYPELQVVALTLIGQTGGMLAGFLLAWLWIARAGDTRFWRAIHWRRLKPETVLGMLAGGAAMMVVVQLLGHVLPMPSGVPMDRLFTPHTAWLLLIYGIAIAPFFEEFFFRGLLYPTLRSAFAEGMTAAELRPWRPLVRVLAAIGALVGVYWYWRAHMLADSPALHVAGAAGSVAGIVVGLVLLAWPDPLVTGAGALINLLARWRRPELLAIFVTGLLFGLMHAAQLGWAWAAVLIMVIVGVVLTVMRATTGSLMASWIFHCAYNGTLFAAQYFATQGFHHFTQGPH